MACRLGFRGDPGARGGGGARGIRVRSAGERAARLRRTRRHRLAHGDQRPSGNLLTGRCRRTGGRGRINGRERARESSRAWMRRKADGPGRARGRRRIGRHWRIAEGWRATEGWRAGAHLRALESWRVSRDGRARWRGADRLFGAPGAGQTGIPRPGVAAALVRRRGHDPPPVTFAVSAHDRFPWPRRAWPGPDVYRRSACHEPGPAPP
jgi:hypothetical protein